jgi:hypothetical protein
VQKEQIGAITIISFGRSRTIKEFGAVFLVSAPTYKKREAKGFSLPFHQFRKTPASKKMCAHLAVKMGGGALP